MNSPTTLEDIQTQIRNRFRSNMAVLQRYFPDIFKIFCQYEPKELTLRWDNRGFLNLVNIRDNAPVYPINPKDYAKAQFDEYLQAPQVASVEFLKGKIINHRHAHGRLVNDLIDKTAPYIATAIPDCKAPIGTLVLTGIGMGYHLELMVNKLDIRNLIIYEPHMDAMYASLHIIDWQTVADKLCRPERLVQIYLAFDPVLAVRNMRTLKERIGLHNLIYTYIYRHVDSVQEAAYIDMFYRENHLNFFGSGFFEDEQTGLAHTVHNINNKTRVFKPDPTASKPLPAFIVGNGPSLDDHIDFLKENADRAVVFSCGTALSSISKAGIKPDFHIEMERNINIVEWIKQGTTAEQRAGLTLLCLNTSSPKVIELFDKACMAKKPFDVGESVIDKAMGNIQIEALTTPNPTVTNAGLSFALHMGFTTIYLIGIDLGIASDGKHHSKLSIYQDLENKTKEKGHSPIENTENNYFVTGNFSDQVSTNHILDTSRQNMEYLIDQFKTKNPNIRGFNSNNGVKINGFSAIKTPDIKISPSPTDKQALIEQLQKEHFLAIQSPAIDKQLFKQRDLKTFFNFRGKLTLKKSIDTPAKLIDELDKIFCRLIAIKKSDPITYRLLVGSANTYFTILAKSCLFQKNRAQFCEAYALCRSSYMQFIKEAYELMESKPFMLDDTPDKVAIRLAKQTDTQ